jgi:hypothetical protein
MLGDVLGKPVKYRLEVQPVLRRAFTELYMTDVQKPPEYEATRNPRFPCYRDCSRVTGRRLSDQLRSIRSNCGSTPARAGVPFTTTEILCRPERMRCF